MKHYDYIIRNYGIVLVHNPNNHTISGHIDYVGNNPSRKRQGNGFIIYNVGRIAFDFPESVPAYLEKALMDLFF